MKVVNRKFKKFDSFILFFSFFFYYYLFKIFLFYDNVNYKIIVFDLSFLIVSYWVEFLLVVEKFYVSSLLVKI